MAGIGIITNPHSKLNKRNPHRPKLLSYIAGQQGRLEITNSIEELHGAAERFRRQGISILAINGGDGTISRTLTAFIAAYGDEPLPAVALLRGGTMNMLAQNLGIKGPPEQLLYRLIQSHSAGADLAAKPVRALKVNDQFGFLFASGTSARFLEAFYRNKTGALGSVALVLKIMVARFLYRPFFRRVVRSERLAAQFDERFSVLHRTCSVLCASVRKTPLGVPLFPKAGQHLFHCVSMAMTATALVRRLLATVLLAPTRPAPDKLSLPCERLVLEGPGASYYTLDGELFEEKSEKVTISLGPTLRFVVL